MFFGFINFLLIKHFCKSVICIHLTSCCFHFSVSVRLPTFQTIPVLHIEDFANVIFYYRTWFWKSHTRHSLLLRFFFRRVEHPEIVSQTRLPWNVSWLSFTGQSFLNFSRRWESHEMSLLMWGDNAGEVEKWYWWWWWRGCWWYLGRGLRASPQTEQRTQRPAKNQVATWKLSSFSLQS